MIVAFGICMLLFMRTNTENVKDTGIVEPSCLVKCTCCKNRDCGPEGYFREDNCYSGCIDGYRGGRCAQKCNYPYCAECTQSASICIRCKAGYYPGSSFDCSSKCPISCKTCSSSTICTECTDGYYNANDFTDCRYRYCPVNCKCEHNQCTSCTDGFYNIALSCINKCPLNCVTCLSQDICDACREGKYNGYEFDFTERPLLNNCTNECPDNCITCSSYKNCLQCKTGRYGITCQNECSVGCENEICQFNSGNCKCKNNFYGDSCTECVPGKYGALCLKNCPLSCKHRLFPKLDRYVSECESQNGECLNGCENGFFGSKCNEACSTQCTDNVCMQDTGICTKGCNGLSDDPVCHRQLENRKSENLNQTPLIVMGVIVVFLSIVTITAVVFKFVVCKRRSKQREQKHSAEVVSKIYTIPMTENVNLAIQNERAPDLECTDTTEYEQLELGQVQGMAAEKNT